MSGRRLALLLALVAVSIPAAASAQSGGGRFPHARHEGLFPLCVGCHRGIESGVAADVFPPAELCARCHDGQSRPRVAVPARTHTPSNLHFSHQRHATASAAGGRAPECVACHRAPGESGAMNVGRPVQRDCAVCHTAAAGHIDSRVDCRQCHVALTQATSLAAERIAAFPRPASHGAADFLHTHGPTADVAATTCAVCHARESCERCHLDAARIPAVTALARDSRVAALVAGRAPSYPKPASHGATWKWGHGAQAAAHAVGCADCHTRASCRSCHRQGELRALDAIPAPAPSDPRGVRLPAASVHPPRFVSQHATDAAAGTNCEACHARSFCTDCHRSPTRSAFHASDFLERHGTDVWASDTECTACHNTETFCRACHCSAGVAQAGRSGAAFHGTQPLWLLSHGQAARQGLEGCTACHTQTDCTRCHSANGGWGVNPHGAAFDPARQQDRNVASCLRCHTIAQLAGSRGGGR